MFKLYGFRHSSYYSIVKLALLEKRLSFEEISLVLNESGRLDFEPSYLRKSPMGKVPCLECPHGFLSETSVILDYLDEAAGGPSFYPSDPFGRAKVRELIKQLELYVELPARRLYGEFFGRPASESEKREVKRQLESGFASIARLARFAPYIAGPEITFADFFAYFALTSATRTTKAVYGWDTFNTIQGIRPLLTRLADRESVKRIMADRSAGAAQQSSTTGRG